jgi:hypothetical protein
MESSARRLEVRRYVQHHPSSRPGEMSVSDPDSIEKGRRLYFLEHPHDLTTDVRPRFLEIARA